MNLKQRDSKYIWHPFDQMKGADVLPIIKGEGCYLFDENGKKYLDGFSSWWVNGHGHCNSYIREKVHDQMTKLEFLLLIDNSTTSSIGIVLSRRTLLPSFVFDIKVLDP